MAKRRSLAQRQYSLERAVNKATQELQALQKKGFRINKRTLKAFSAESIAKKMQKATKKDIEYYKSFTKKKNLYGKMTGYLTDRGKLVSVKQGKQFEKVKTTKRETYSNIDLVRERLKELSPQVVSRTKQRGLYVNKEYNVEDIQDDISNALNMLSDIEELGSDITEETANYIIEQVDSISHYGTNYNADIRFTNIKRSLQSYLNDDSVSANVSEEDFSTINTPYENKGFESE